MALGLSICLGLKARLISGLSTIFRSPIVTDNGNGSVTITSLSNNTSPIVIDNGDGTATIL